MFLFRLIYNILFVIVGICGMPYFLIHYLTKKSYREHLAMRFGFYPQHVKDIINSGPFIWFHAVSVGEVNSTQPIVEKIKKAYPGHKILLTTTTPTGYMVANRIYAKDAKNMAIAFFPLDFFFLFNPIFRKNKPVMAVFVETEIWPNYICLLKKLRVPMFLVNGRISDTSYKRYMLVRPFFSRLMSTYAACFMQSEDDGDKLIQLGVDRHKVFCFGNLKYEACFNKTPALSKQDQKTRLEISQERLVIIAGSTHPGEEEILVEVYRKLTTSYQNLTLVIAPRHTERTPEIEKILAKYNFDVRKVSQISEPPTIHLGSDDVVLVDTIGDLFNVYEAADMVFVGKTLAAKGGQNMVEPAVLGKALLFGPNTENFVDAVKILQKNKACVIVKTKQDLYEKLRDLIKNEAKRNTLSSNAKEAFKHHINTTKLVVEKINSTITAHFPS